MQKRKITVIALILVCVAFVSSGTLAYFTAEEKTHNVITTGNVEIELYEWADSEKKTPFEPVEGVMPGTTVTKIVEVKNVGGNDAFVRVKVDKEILLKDQQDKCDLEVVSLDINRNYWEEKDGFYYYKEILESGAETKEPIFTTVTFADGMENIYQKCTVNINVSAQAVQADNNGTDSLTASGWPE